MDTEQRLGDARSPRKLEQGRIGPSSGASGGSVSPPTPGPRPRDAGFGLQASRTGREETSAVFSGARGALHPSGPRRPTRGGLAPGSWPAEDRVTGCMGWALSQVPPVPGAPVHPWPRALGAGPSPHSDSDTVLRPRHPVRPPRCPPSSAPACSLPSPPLLRPLPCLPLLLYSAGGHTSACSPPPRSSAGFDRVPGGSWPPSPRTASVPLPADAGLAPQGPESICAPWRLRLDFALSAQHSPLPRVPLLHSRILCVAPPEGRLPEGRGLAVSLPAVPPVPGAWPVLRDTFAQWMRERTNEGEQGHRQQVAGRPEGPPGRDAASPSPLLPRNRTAALADGHRRWAPASPRTTWRAGGRATRAAEPSPRAAGPRPWPCPLVSQGVGRGRGPSRRSEAGQRPGGGRRPGGGAAIAGSSSLDLATPLYGTLTASPLPECLGLLSPVGTSRWV